MNQPKELHPMFMSLEHLDWTLSHVEIWSTTLAWDGYNAQGEIGYAADTIRVRADWEVYLLPAGIKGGKDGFLIDFRLHMECGNYGIDSRSSFGTEWPEHNEMQVWLQTLFSSLPLADDLKPHLPLPVIDQDDL